MYGYKQKIISWRLFGGGSEAFWGRALPKIGAKNDFGIEKTSYFGNEPLVKRGSEAVRGRLPSLPRIVIVLWRNNWNLILKLKVISEFKVFNTKVFSFMSHFLLNPRPNLNNLNCIAEPPITGSNWAPAQISKHWSETNNAWTASQIL